MISNSYPFKHPGNGRTYNIRVEYEPRTGEVVTHVDDSIPRDDFTGQLVRNKTRQALRRFGSKHGLGMLNVKMTV